MKLYKRKPDDRAPLGQPDPYMMKTAMMSMARP